MLAYRRQPDLLVFSTIQPVMFVLLFAYVFGGAIQTGPVDYIDFLLPGILAQSVLFGSTQTGVGLAVDVTSGMIDRYRTLPMARSAVVAGRILADTTRNVFVVGLMLGVGFLIGFRYHGTVAGAIAMPFVAVLFGQTFCWISAAIGTSVRRAETAQVASFVWLFPLVFVSSVFVPVETMPDWLEGGGREQPGDAHGQRDAGAGAGHGLLGAAGEGAGLDGGDHGGVRAAGGVAVPVDPVGERWVVGVVVGGE